ncbi:unnamed protein product [Ilex paraguariensis]|uniref:Uncharacterized protein n=1 Tax=Ilex paraguariensis TaxID=185542 RepID=A0ABC8TL83_9AQUA
MPLISPKRIDAETRFKTREGRRCFDGITSPSPIESIDAGLPVLGRAVGKSPSLEANGLFARGIIGFRFDSRDAAEVTSGR